MEDFHRSELLSVFRNIDELIDSDVDIEILAPFLLQQKAELDADIVVLTTGLESEDMGRGDLASWPGLCHSGPCYAGFAALSCRRLRLRREAQHPAHAG